MTDIPLLRDSTTSPVAGSAAATSGVVTTIVAAPAPHSLGGPWRALVESTPVSGAGKASWTVESGKRYSRPGKLQWTAQEDALLRTAVAESSQAFGKVKWHQVAARLHNRSNRQCHNRWRRVLDPTIVKGPWAPEEDAALNALIERFGTSNWTEVGRSMVGRNGKQCRERWCNHLDPVIVKKDWTESEERKLLDLHGQEGPKWSKIAKQFEGRSEVDVKNRWYSLSKQLESLTAIPKVASLAGRQARAGGASVDRGTHHCADDPRCRGSSCEAARSANSTDVRASSDSDEMFVDDGRCCDAVNCGNRGFCGAKKCGEYDPLAS